MTASTTAVDHRRGLVRHHQGWVQRESILSGAERLRARDRCALRAFARDCAGERGRARKETLQPGRVAHQRADAVQRRLRHRLGERHQALSQCPAGDSAQPERSHEPDHARDRARDLPGRRVRRLRQPVRPRGHQPVVLLLAEGTGRRLDPRRRAGVPAADRHRRAAGRREMGRRADRSRVAADARRAGPTARSSTTSGRLPATTIAARSAARSCSRSWPSSFRAVGR